MVRITNLLIIFLTTIFLVSCNIKDDNNKEDETPSFVEENDYVEKISITVDDVIFTATLYENKTAQAFAKLLPLTIEMNDMPHEKYYNLPQSLPTRIERIEMIEAGDLMLWNSNCFVIFYETFETSYSYSKIGKIDDITKIALIGQSNNFFKIEIVK